MPRSPRALAHDATYHLMARGNNERESIFLDDADRSRFLADLARVVKQRSWIHLAHCLMTTHFHVVLTTPQPDLADGMRDLLALYARSFNHRHNRKGRLFRDRYLSRTIEHDEYLMSVLRYVAVNPVDAGIVPAAGDWPWSSYRDTVAGRRTKSLDVDSVLGHVHHNPLRARQILRALVEGHSNLGLSPAENEEDPPVRPGLHTLAQVLPVDDAISEALARGYPRKEVAAALGLTYSAVANRIHRMAARKARADENTAS
jgi:REP element-mobilizing transposase RayT